MNFPHGQSVTVLSTVTTTDDLGDSTTVTTETAWGPCAVAPRASDERTDPRSPAVITALTIYGPSIALDSDDTLRIEGGAYAGVWQVEGIPGDWTSPFTGWAPGIEVAVKRASAV